MAQAFTTGNQPGLHQDEGIYITNFKKHFETVKKM